MAGWKTRLQSVWQKARLQVFQHPVLLTLKPLLSAPTISPYGPNDGVLNLPLRSRPRTAPLTLVQGMWTFGANNERPHHRTADSVESDQHHTEDTT